MDQSSKKSEAAAKLTPWFAASVKPARKGVYQRDWSGGPSFAYWNGRWWCMSMWDDARHAFSVRAFKSHTQNLRWRGLASAPKVSA